MSDPTPPRAIVLVSGGSGYIAAFCIAQLIEQGYHVRTTVRNLARAPDVRATIGKLIDTTGKLDFYAADLNADAGWDEAIKGCDYVLHVASPFPPVNPKDDEQLIRPARDGALRVLKRARDFGIKRVVMTASVACIAYGHGGNANGKPYTEADWTDEKNLADTSAYVRSKTIAERAARDWLAREGAALELVTIHPGAVLGPVLSKDFSTSIELVKKLLDGSIPGLPRFGFPVVDVRDVADMHVRAMVAPGIAGERFIATSSYMWMEDVATILRAGLGTKAKKVPWLKIPDFVLRLSGIFDPLVRGQLYELGKRRDCSSAKAQSVLGWKPRPDKDMVLDTANSLLAQNLV